MTKSVFKSFFIFSCVLIVIIFTIAFTAYIVTARQINNTYIEQQLTVASETMRLRLATTVGSEITLVRKMADTPIIQQHFLNPENLELKTMAHAEFNRFEQHFKNKQVFWINDKDKTFYSTGNESYLVDTEDEGNYWYNMTLNETENYNLNINYNPDIQETNLWVNVPVFFTENGIKKPVGILGTGIFLNDFTEFVTSGLKELDPNITPYMFNKYHEITSAKDFLLVHDKVHLEDHLGDTGKEIIRIAQLLTGDASVIFSYGSQIHKVSAIESMEWYLVVSYPTPGLFALNQAMNTVFFGMLFLILLMFVIMSIFLTLSEKAVKKQNQLAEENRKAQAASQAKSDFLAKMSHEIRTPMNAISGMSELLLRRQLPPEARSDAQDIKQAASNLLSIINDILDFSKIEAGKLELVQANYQLLSLVNDAVNIIRMRIMEKPIRFYTNIDGNIPCNLIGDEVKVRQIILNLLSNAAKYTQKGHVSMSITMEKQEESLVWLKIVVSDTGKGIKSEDQSRLFGDFVQVDISKNRTIEGTGLGLAITKRLCNAMGGDISMQSEYGAGSDFTVLIPQGKTQSNAVFAQVENPQDKKVLVYEGRVVYAKSVSWSLDNLKVPYVMVTNLNDFTESLHRDRWFYVFSSYGLFNKIKPVMDIIPEGKRPPLALMVEWGTETFIPNARFVSLPVQSLSIANVLNGKTDNNDYFTSRDSSKTLRFYFPSVKLLVVDDLGTNLKVAEGLLTPYQAEIDTCLSGAEALELVKQKNYDVIFMDHMMPEMDGIETTEEIRKWEKHHDRKPAPVIALTANAVVGMREMFLEKGFDDFLPKPIDVSKLDEILDKWIPREKREKRSEKRNMGNDFKERRSQNLKTDLIIAGLDIAKGIIYTGGTVENYIKVLNMFCDDCKDRIPLLLSYLQNTEEKNIKIFITHTHALKSALATLGSKELSDKAKALEAAGKAEDFLYIKDNLVSFTQELENLAKTIEGELLKHKEKTKDDGQQLLSSSQYSLFTQLSAALKAQNAFEVDRIMEELNAKKSDSKTQETLDKISSEVLKTEYESALKIVSALLEVHGGGNEN